MKDSLESACSKNEWLKQYSNEGQAELDQLRNVSTSYFNVLIYMIQIDKYIFTADIKSMTDL